MGSGVSKPTNVDASSSSSRSVRKGKCKGSSRVFQSSCLGGASSDDNINICDHDSGDDGGNTSAICRTETWSSWVRTGHRKVKLEQSDEGHPSSNIELDKCSGENVVNAASRSSSIRSLDAFTPSLNSRSGFLSRFSFIPGSVSFRLNRASSLGSSRAYRIPSSSGQMFDSEEVRPQSRLTSSIADGSETRQISDLLPVIRSHHSEDASANSQHYDQSSDILDNNEGDQTMTSAHDAGARRNRGCTKVGNDGTSRSPRIYSDSDSLETRISDRRIGTQEPVEHNVCFSRTLSVGRLRDRVLRRSPSNTTFCPMQQERELRDAIHARRRPALVGETRISESVGDGFNPPTTSDYPPSGTSSSLLSAREDEPETTRSRDTRYHDLLEHRSNFLERRRRIRSQVRALQRLGSRFENLSGHDRSCILSGHHRTGHCTCRTTNRDANLNDDTSARASISRIVMLAEALFEVLDEIHQQSVVLSSQPSLSSLGSVPAPNEVVESLPVELYSKFQKHQNEEAAQCYICLVEYEEGDSMRILPCHHEFHRTCIDKWLKEIHRVCPLCRGDVCRSESVAAER